MVDYNLWPRMKNPERGIACGLGWELRQGGGGALGDPATRHKELERPRFLKIFFKKEVFNTCIFFFVFSAK